MNKESLIIGSAILMVMGFWWIFFRERIGYMVPNVLFAKYQRTPIRIWMLWLVRTMIVASIVFMIIPLTQRVTTTVVEPVRHHILIILDISRSMLAEDILPSRIESAKRSITSFLAERKGDTFALMVFAGKPFISIPFSDDKKGILSVLSDISPYYIRQELPGLSGTALGDAILLGASSLSGSKEESSIVLVTDGRANLGIDPLIAIAPLIQQSIPIFTIAIGGEGSGSLSYTDPFTGKKVPLLDEGGAPVVGGADTALLETMSQKTGGASFRAKNTHELSMQLTTIAEKLGHKTISTQKSIIRTYRIEIFCMLMLLIGIERFLTERIFYKNRQ